MAHGKKPTEKDLKKLGKPVPKGGVKGGRKYGNKPKMAHGDKPKMYGKPKMYNKKPFMMEPGSKEIDSPGSFKANEPAMIFKNNMPKMDKMAAARKRAKELAKGDAKKEARLIKAAEKQVSR